MIRRLWFPRQRQRFVKRMAARLHRRLPLRLHMTIMLLAVIAFGVVSSQLLMLAGIEARSLRWSLGVVLAYLFFLLCVRFWLDRIHPELDTSAREYAREGVTRVLDVAGPAAEEAVAQNVSSVAWPSDAFSDYAPETRGEASGSGWRDASERRLRLPSIDLDEEDTAKIAAIIAIIILVIGLIVAATVFIVQAPAILGEAGGEALLAVAIRRRLGRPTTNDWLASVLGRTIFIALAILALAAIAGAVVDNAEVKRRRPSPALPIQLPRDRAGFPR